MRPKEIDIDLVDVDADGIAQSQTPSGAGNFTLNGALGTTLDYARQLSFTSASDESGDTYTITGTDADGNVITEQVTGPNATTVESVNYYKTITSIATSGAATGAITIGTVDEAVSATIPLNWRGHEAATVSVDVTGTISFTVQETFDNVLSNGTANTDWNNVTALATKTADTTAQVSLNAMAIRVVINSYSSGAELQVRIAQSG